MLFYDEHIRTGMMRIVKVENKSVRISNPYHNEHSTEPAVIKILTGCILYNKTVSIMIWFYVMFLYKHGKGKEHTLIECSYP